jgi:hypothetical protein
VVAADLVRRAHLTVLDAGRVLGLSRCDLFAVSSAQPTALYVPSLRNMLVNSAFGFPIQQVPQDGNPASTAAVLGAYYPKAVKCTLSTLTSGGPAASLTQK